MPTAIVANSKFGEAHVHSSWRGRPCRSPSGIASTPPGSTATTFVPYASWACVMSGSVTVAMSRILAVPRPRSRPGPRYGLLSR